MAVEKDLQECKVGLSQLEKKTKRKEKKRLNLCET